MRNSESSEKKKSKMQESDFIKLLKCHPCLLNRSQTPDMKIKKQNALEALEEQIKKVHGVNLKISQIRKKIENMKARAKLKGGRKKTGNHRTVLKAHEKQFLDLMKHTGQYNPDLNTIPVTEAESYVEQAPSNDRLEDEHLVVQKEVLLEQKALNKEKRELYIQQKEIFALQKEKLLLEIAILKKQKR